VEVVNVTLAVFLVGAVALIVLGVILYRSRLEIGSKGPRSIARWLWYVIVAEIAWFSLICYLRGENYLLLAGRCIMNHPCSSICSSQLEPLSFVEIVDDRSLSDKNIIDA
jgi:hypothetical protein